MNWGVCEHPLFPCRPPDLGPSIPEDHGGVYESGAPLFRQRLGPEWPQRGSDAPSCVLPK